MSIEKLISEKEKEVKELKPKFYLLRGYLSTFITLHLLQIILLPIFYFLIKNILIDPNIEITNLMIKICFFVLEFFIVLLSFDFRVASKITDKKLNIYNYKYAGYELYELKRNKRIIDESKQIKNKLNLK